MPHHIRVVLFHSSLRNHWQFGMVQDRSPIRGYQGAIMQRDMPITFRGKSQHGSVEVTFNARQKRPNIVTVDSPV